MKYLLFIIFAVAAFAQNPRPSAAGSAGCVQVHSSTGNTISCGGSTIVASLPSASANASAIYLVHDGATSSDCTMGGGTSRSLCVSNGSVWVALGGGSGVSSIIAGTGISVDHATGAVTVTNTAPGASPAGSQFDVDFTGAGGTVLQAITGAFRVSTPAIGTTPAITSVTPTCSGTCVTAYGYVAVARGIISEANTISAEVTTTNAASLDGSHHNVITPGACIANQTSTDIQRSTPAIIAGNLIGNVTCGGTLNDTGQIGYGPSLIASSQTNSFASSQGLLVPDTLRANSTNGLIVGPDYLAKTRANFTDVFFGGIADSGWEVSVDISTGSSAGMYNTFTVYNASSTGVPAKKLSQWFCDAYLHNDGSSGLQDCGITDDSIGNPTSGIAIFTLSPLDSFWNCMSPCGTIDTGGTFFFGSVVPTILQASGYNSSDGTAGTTGNGFKNGLCTTSSGACTGGLLPILSGTTGSIGGGLLTAGSCTSGTTSIATSTTSMVALADPNTYPGDGLVWDAQITSNGTATVKVCAIVALTPAASTYNVRVIQ